MSEQREEREVAIKVSGVKKMYKLGQIGGGTLQADLQSWWARKRGKEDPNTKIGQEQRLVGQTFMALNGIDLTIYQGEAVGIIGSNGAGKSTLLKLLSRVTAPTEGDIDIYGRITSMLEVGTGFNGEMTGRENVYLNGAILGMTKAEIDAKIDQIIEFSEVGDFIDTPVKRYSSGMYVKLAFSVAAHLDSEIMIMDEVLAVGDMKFQQKCLTKMRDAATTEGKTVLYVSHNMNTIRQLCERCIVLDKGKVVFNGNVEKAISIYMGGNSENNTSIDYTKCQRERWLTNPSIRCLWAEFIGKKTNEFGAKEPVKLRCGWENVQDVTDVYLRIEVWSADGIGQASYMLCDFYSGKKGKKAEISMELDISQLADEEYQLVLVFFNKDMYGSEVILECVKGLWLTKTMMDEKEAWVWNPHAWGYINMPSPKIINFHDEQ